MTMDVDDEAESPFLASKTIKSTKQERSIVWKFFSRVGTDKFGIERAVCNYCGQSYIIGKNLGTKINYGTSQLSRHISVCKSIANSDVNMDEMLANQQGNTSMTKINQDTRLLTKITQVLTNAVLEHDFPLNFLESTRAREFVKCLNPDLKMPSRNAVELNIQKIYMQEMEKLKQVMSRIPNRVCLSYDVWTTPTTEDYICLSVHFVDDNWKFNNKILNFCYMMYKPSRVELEATLLDCLKPWGIDKKVFSITSDNTTSNYNIEDILRNHLHLQNKLLCDGEFFHVRCSAHILDLIVQEGLNMDDKVLCKIRDSVYYVTESYERMIKFQDCAQQAHIDTSVALRLDMSRNWKSTYMMLDCAIKYEKAFDILQVVDEDYKYCPSEEEWRRGKKMHEFLEPFFETAYMISNSSYPTSNLYLLKVLKIQYMLEEKLLNDEDMIKDMFIRMKEKFEKYWKEYSIVLAFGVILDPRFKLDFLNFCYSKLDPSTSHEKVKYVREI